MDPNVIIIIAAILGIGFIIFYSWRRNKLEELRKQEIYSHLGEWGQETCDTLVSKQVAINMTPEMVILAWGRPSKVDQKEILKSGINKERWVYGVPRKNANYVYFKGGKVVKIQTS